nr:hypothetical protein [Spirochaetaceae bacterium]
IFFDNNRNRIYDSGESQGIVKFQNLSELESGINVTFKNYDIEKEKLFNRPIIQHDLSMNSLPPQGFEKKDNDKGIGIIDFNYSEPLWFYKETKLEQIIKLVGSDPTDKWNSDGSPDSGTFKFDLPDGGIVMFGFNKEGLWMIYPRHTTRFTLNGFPRLPWNKDTIIGIFGTDAGYKLTKEEEEIFVGVGNEPGMTGFRLDSKDMMGDGFRIWIPEGSSSTQ